MKISKAQWERYIKLTSALKGTARKKMDAYIAQHGISDMDAVIDYAYGLATKYGEGTSAVAAEMYDGIARAQGAKVPSAEPAPTASYKDTAKAVTYAKGRGQSLIPGAVETLVKQAGADTMLRNAARDGAEFAWVPHGSETCPMCMTIASNGWRRASRKTMKGDHADHIHSSCDCEFVIRFDGKSTVEGYDPDALREQYDNAEGSTWKEKVNSLRREQYKANGEKIRKRKRTAYARKTKLHSITNRSIINKKIGANGEVLNPMDKEEYNGIVRRLKKQGIHILAATKDDDLRYMLLIGAEGTYSDGWISHIGEVPSRGTLFEEIIHMQQARKYGELKNTDFVELYAREIEANRKLLRYQKNYKLDANDIEDIEKNLSGWEYKFRTKVGVSYDESNYRSNV